MSKPIIGLGDIETTPNLACIWQPGKQVIGYENIVKEKKISCICWKTLNSKKIYSLQMNLKMHDYTAYDDDADKEMLEKFSEVYETFDNFIGHNGIRFDIATIRARLAKYNLPDLKPTILDDTYLQSKPLRFNSLRLDYLGQYFNVGRKADHPYKLWLDVMYGVQRALDDTVKYCKRDVELLEKVYKKLRPYIKLKFNHATFNEDVRACPKCGSKHTVKNGFGMVSTLMKKQIIMCKECHSHSYVGKNLLIDTINYPR